MSATVRRRATTTDEHFRTADVREIGLIAQPSPIAAGAASWDRSRIAFVAFATIQFFGSLLLNPLGIPQDKIPEWLGLSLLGAFVFSTPVLFGIWAALGPGGAIPRVMTTAIVLCGIIAASCFRDWNLLTDADRIPQVELNEWIYMLVLFGIALLVAAILRWFTGWRLAREVGRDGDERNQVSLRFLMIWTAACAVVLTIGRSWTDLSNSTRSSSWTVELVELLQFIGLVLLILLPIVIAPLVVLLPRWSWRTFLIAIAAWACLTLLGIEAMAAIENDPRWKAAVLLSAIQAGCLVVSMTGAALLRWAGYRVIKAPRGGALK